MALLLGSAPNQISVNSDLGTAAFIDAKQLPVSGPQKAINDAQDIALALKAPIASPAFTGTVKLPSVTTTQKNALTGLTGGCLVFDTTLAKSCVYNGTAWETITSVA
jgi:hypothetical protein